MAKLRTDDLWARITSLSKKSTGRYVAVAWLASGASKQLRMERDDVLVIDMSDGSVRAGRTDPKEVIAYLKKGVLVYSVTNLHAKVFVLGRHVIVGSTNVSTHSRDTLLEAAIETADPNLRRQATLWVKSQAKKQVTPAIAVAKMKIYQPPKWGTPAGLIGRKATLGKNKKKVASTDGRLWIVGTEVEKEWPKDVAAVLTKQKQEARKKLPSRKLYWIETLRFPATKLWARARRDDTVITIHDDGKSTGVWAPAPITIARRFHVGDSRGIGVHLQRSHNHQCYTLKSFVSFCKKLGVKITPDMELEVTSPAAKHAILGEFQLAKK